MRPSQRTWCRVCGTELALPRWKALVGLNAATCADEGACLLRYTTKRARSVAAGRQRTHDESSLPAGQRRR